MTSSAALTPPARPGAPAGPERLLAGWHDTGAAARLGEHLDRYGDLPLAGRPGRPARLIEEVGAAGLLGRGGAFFPTARKLAAVAASRRRPVVVANGCEGEPAGRKDTALLTLAPHLVLDGAVLAAHALGASEVVVCVHEGAPAHLALHRALAERDDPVPARVVAVPPWYVASQETALVHFLDTGDPRPTTAPPRPAERGVGGRPTLVDNVETLAHLALVERFGAEWFRSVGTPDLPGTLLVTVGGAVAGPGVFEIAGGTGVDAALQLAGGPDGPVQAVLSGGYGGGWLPWPGARDLPMTGPRTGGAALGAAVLLALPAGACGLAETAHLLHYLAAESAGQCGPCVFGLPAVASDVAGLVTGRPGAAAVLGRLRRRLGVIPGRGACAHPDGAVRLATSALEVFADDLAEHLAGRPCAGAGEPPLFPVPGRS